MNPLYLVGAGIGGAVAGFYIGWKVRGKRAEKEIEDIQEFDKRQIQSLDKKLQELRSSINVSLTEKEKVWTEIGKEPKEVSDADSIAADTKKNESQLSYRKKNDERVNYNAVTTALKYDDKASQEDREAARVIRDYADNGIFEITEKEYYESSEFVDEEFEYYDASGDLFKDGVKFDDDEIPLYLGYSKDELAARFLYDEPRCIYIRNPEYEKIYVVYWCKGLMPE